MIKGFVLMIFVFGVLYFITIIVLVKKIANMNASLRRTHEMSDMMIQWATARENDRSVYEFLEKKGYHSMIFLCPKKWKNMLGINNKNEKVHLIEQEELKISVLKQNIIPGDYQCDVVILVDPGTYRELSYRIYDLIDAPILNLADILTLMNKESEMYA